MKSGDVAVGYDLTDVQFVDDDAEKARAAALQHQQEQQPSIFHHIVSRNDLSHLGS